MKKPAVLLYACCALLSIAASLLLDLDDPRTGNLRRETLLPDGKGAGEGVRRIASTRP